MDSPHDEWEADGHNEKLKLEKDLWLKARMHGSGAICAGMSLDEDVISVGACCRKAEKHIDSLQRITGDSQFQDSQFQVRDHMFKQETWQA